MLLQWDSPRCGIMNRFGNRWSLSLRVLYLQINYKMNKGFIILYCLLLFSYSVSFGQQLSPAQQIADFDTLCAKLEYVHPDLYLYQSREEYENNKNTIKSSMTDSISISDFYLNDVYFGNYLHFTLPNSKIDYYISFSKFYE